jgi:ATP-dependent Zn protease
MELATSYAIKLVCEFSWSTMLPRMVNAEEWKHDPQAGDIVSEANAILEEAGEMAVKILRKNRDLVASLAERLQAEPSSSVQPEELKKLSMQIEPANFVKITRSGFSA